MADDAAGAVRRTPRPTQAIRLWWNPANQRVLWAAEENGWCSTGLVARHFDETLPSDAVQLVGPDQRRPVVLLRADDCDCGPPYADCPHGPEPVDALDLAVWLHAESRWQLELAEEHTRDIAARRSDVAVERDALQARIDAAVRWLDDPQELTPAGQLYQIRAALQGDQPTEPDVAARATEVADALAAAPEVFREDVEGMPAEPAEEADRG